MITEASISEVRDRAEIVEVAKRLGVDLKKKGSTLSGCCPFHDEKTPSFQVSPSKGIYKCFGCGEGGDAIKFVMKVKNEDFISSIRILAEWFNVTLEETEQPAEEKKVLELRGQMLAVNEAAAKKYQKQLLEMRSQYGPAYSTPLFELLENRKLSIDTIIEFQLGFAPEEWRFLSAHLVEKGLFQIAVQLGLTGSKNATNYDIYKNRIMFPIHNEKGTVVGFGGRLLEVKGEKKRDDQPKYLNSADSPVYRKERILYGLYQAQQSIRKLKHAIVVEGYYDVISFHQNGVTNTVAPCGTALTDTQCKILKKYCSHVILIGDGDATGLKSNLKSIDLLLRNGFKVDILQLEDGQDPDSFARMVCNPEPVDSLEAPYSLEDEEEELEMEESPI